MAGTDGIRKIRTDIATDMGLGMAFSLKWRLVKETQDVNMHDTFVRPERGGKIYLFFADAGGVRRPAPGAVSSGRET
jgi:hypothetical protein